MVFKIILLCAVIGYSFQAQTLRELRFVGGSVGTTSVYSLPSWKAENAFLQGSNQVWHSGRNAQGTGNLDYAFPHLIWYKFRQAFIPARLSFKSRPSSNSGCGSHGCAATKYQFIGTNDPKCDQYSKWTVVCEDLSGDGISNINSSPKYCTVDERMRESFSCLGISVLDSAYTGASEVSINGIRMWARD